MKRIILAICTIILILSLVACSNTNDNNDVPVVNPAEQENNNTSINLTDVYNSIISAQPEELRDTLVFFPETDKDTIDTFYPGLSEIALKQEAIYLPAIDGFAQEIALVEVENSENVKKVEEIFNKRIETGKTTEGCDPGIPELWERYAQVQVKGNYVCMIVLSGEFTIPENVFGE